MNKGNVLTVAALVAVALVLQGCANRIWCFGGSSDYSSLEECETSGGNPYEYRDQWEARMKRHIGEKAFKNWETRKSRRPSSKSFSSGGGSNSCSSSSLNSYERQTCWTKKCLKYQMLLSLGGGNTSGWMAKCMALRGNSWPASGSRSSCTGPYCKYESAWDYLPGSREWRCRDTGGARGGEFVPSSECSSQKQVDNWP